MTPLIHIAFDVLSGVDGSARFSFGPTIALASVSGPIAARLATEHPVRATVDVHVRPLSSVPGITEKHAATALKGVLERTCILAQHPRTLIQVVVQALSSSSSRSAGVWRASSVSSRTGGVRADMDRDGDADADVLLAAEINACSLALLNAGSIPMRGVVCAVAVAQSASTSRPQLFTEAGVRGNQEYAGCFAFLFGIDRAPVEGDGATGPVPPSKLIWTNYRASPGNAYPVTALTEAEEVALEGAAAVWTEMKESLGVSSFAGDGPSREGSRRMQKKS